MCLRCRISIRNNFGNKNGNSILKNFVENFSKPYFAQANVSRFSVMSVFVFRNLWLEIRNRIGKLKWKYFVFLTVCRFTFTNSSYKKLLVWFLSENILLYLSFSYICNVQWTKYATSCSCKTLEYINQFTFLKHYFFKFTSPFHNTFYIRNESWNATLRKPTYHVSR